MVDDSQKQLQMFIQDFKVFVSNKVFLLGVGIGFVLCILISSAVGLAGMLWTHFINSALSLVIGFFANSIWEKYKKKKRGNKPYWFIRGEEDKIYFEAQAQNTASNKAAIDTTIDALSFSQTSSSGET